MKTHIQITAGIVLIFTMLARLRICVVIFGIVFGLFLVGCKGISTQGEKSARRDFQEVTTRYRPQGQHPRLQSDSGLSNYLHFAILNQPTVEAAYYDWAASIERITQRRSRPDPRLTFSADIKDVLMGLMGGLMVDLPGPGKLRAGANVASAESTVKYFAFEKAVLQAAFNLKRAYYQLYFLGAKIDVNKQTLALLSDLEKLARSQNEVGKVTLQDVLRAQIEQDRLATEVANLDDSRNPLMAQFKAALGMKAEEASPPAPDKFETTPLNLTPDKLFATALQRNPRIQAMEAEVFQAEAAIGLARTARVPDFTVGLEVDVFTSPTLITPQVGITLPIWRDKIAAQIAESQANKRAAEARLSSEQIILAVDFAEKTFSYRESSRNLALLQEKLLPKAKQSHDVARASYLSGRASFLDLIDAERTLLNFQLMEVDARVQREVALAELSLIIIGLPPTDAPLLPPSQSTFRKPENKKRKR